MKSLLFVLLCAATRTFAQSYVPVINEAHTWKEQVVGWTTMKSTYWFSGDTVIGETVYHKLYRSDDDNPGVNYLQGMYREDVPNQRVYVWLGDGEGLVYDFTLTEGQQITIAPQGFDITATVSSVDTEWVDGEWRKRIHFNFEWYFDEWVVGRGASMGFSTPLTSFSDFEPRLNCFYVGNDLAWGNPLYEEDCALHLSTADEVKHGIVIYPNPAHELLGFAAGGHGAGVPFEVRSLTGQRVISGVVINRTIDVQSLSPGGYVLSLNLAGVERHFRFLKQ